jgi:type-F conjugative transfer system pilin assembly protein TrbC
MAQEKLLSVLILIIAFTLNTSAAEGFKFKQEDMDFAQDFARRSRQISMVAIKEKWQELQQQIQTSEGDLDNIEEAGIRESYTLRVFVSSSMNKQLLKHYIEQAKRYKAVLVFNGLPNGSWRELAELIYEITGGTAENTAVQLDDISFKEYSINSVPSFVLSREEDIFNQDREVEYDKVSGNIGIKRALEEISENGDLSEIAQAILDEARL